MSLISTLLFYTMPIQSGAIGHVRTGRAIISFGEMAEWTKAPAC